MSNQEETVDIDEVIRSACKTVLEEDGDPIEYNPEMVETWTADIIQLILSTLSAGSSRHGSNFRKKYVCHVVLVQSVGAGVHCNTGSIWNNGEDNYVMLPYATGTINIICTVYSLSWVKPPLLEMPAPN